MRVKKGVRIFGIKPELTLGLIIAEGVYLKHGIELVITSVIDSKHGQHSLHYVGYAVDLRTRDFKDKEEQLAVCRELRDALGNDFDVVLEKDHIHLEFQPQTGYTV